MHVEQSNTIVKQAGRGYWEPVTATLDWCEDNYRVTQYVAEFWNSVSSLLFIVAGLFGIRNHLLLPSSVRLSFLGVALVGVGSFLFHGTLKFSMQLLDELPMLYTEAYMISCFCSFRVKMVIFLFCSVFTVVYSFNRIPLLFQWAYGVLQVICLSIFYKGSRQNSEPNLSKVLTGSFLFTAFAFILWNVDNNMCQCCLRPVKEQMRFPALLELHAWWHVFSCMGAYWFIVGMCFLTPQVQELKPRIEFRFFGLVPMLLTTTNYQKVGK